MRVKRYYLSLDADKVEEFQEHARNFRMAKSAMSSLCNDAITGMNDVFRKAAASGDFTIADLFRLVGEQFELIQQEEKQHAESTQKAAGMEKRAKRKS